jgi:hypothetical protein
VPGYAGVIDQDTWAGPASEWAADPEQRGVFWNEGLFFGNAGIQFRGPALKQDGASISLFVMPDRRVTPAGYRLDAVHAGNRIHFRLSCQGKQRETALPVADDPPVFSLRREGGEVIARLDGEDRLRLPGPAQATGAWQLGFWTGGVKPRVSSFTYWTDHTYNDTFQSAPCEWWVGRGAWTHTNRWSCSPGWTWLAGTGSMAPVLWSKKAFAGDFTVEAFVANKMDLPAPPGYSHPGNLNVTVCGDGRTLGSGYSFLYGGWHYTASGMFRKGHECVPRTPKGLIRPAANTNMDFHRHWFRVRVERRGNRLRHWVDDRLLSDYEDPNPIPSGRLAL